MLGALAGDPVELADGDGELTAGGFLRPSVQRNEVLHGALAERSLTQDHATVIVLNRAREDLRSRGAEAIHQHRQWAVIRRSRLRIIEHFEATGRVLELHDGSVIDEQSGQRGGFRKVTATIAT